MENITNRTLFVTMIIIGIITVALIIPLYGNGTLRVNNLGASAYLGVDDMNVNLPGSSDVYIPNLNTNYQVSAFRTSTTRTETTTSTQPTTKTYYYTTYDNGANLPDESGYYPNTNGGYVPPGCESGTDYSTTTNEPCG